jgi:hypothetical protein
VGGWDEIRCGWDEIRCGWDEIRCGSRLAHGGLHGALYGGDFSKKVGDLGILFARFLLDFRWF